MSKTIKTFYGLVFALFCLSTISFATPAQDLAQLSVSVNSYADLKAQYRMYYVNTENIHAGPTAGTIATANYSFNRAALSARLEFQVPTRDVTKIVNGKVYHSSRDGDYEETTLQNRLMVDINPGFETTLFNQLMAVTVNRISSTQQILKGQVIGVSSPISIIEVHIENHLPTRIDYKVSGNYLAQQMYLEYAQDSGVLYLARTALRFPGSKFTRIIEYNLPNFSPAPTSSYALALAPAQLPSSPPADPSPWLPGMTAKFEQGSHLSPFTSYGSAGEEVPGQSGALQLAYTDLMLPGINGLDVTIKRSYLSQQMLANPKPTSFQDNPFQVNYDPVNFLSQYKVLQPDGWTGWMGKGWQTNIGGELYVNEIYSFAVAGPMLPPSGKAFLNYSTMRNFTFQTADGVRMDFGQEFNEKSEIDIGFSIYNLIGDIYNHGQVAALDYWRTQLENQGKIQPAPRFLYAKDKRSKMKMEIVSPEHYVMYAPDGKKYHFEKQVFQKESVWKNESTNGSIVARSRSAMEYRFVSRVLYLTKVEDVQSNAIQYEYEKTFDTISKSGSGSSNERGYSISLLQVYDLLGILLFPAPVNPQYCFLDSMNQIEKMVETAKTMALNSVNQYGIGVDLSLGNQEKINNLQKILTTDLVNQAYQDVMLQLMQGVCTVVSPLPAPWKQMAQVLVIAMLYGDISDITKSYSTTYAMEGWRPKRIVDSLGRNVDIEYRSGWNVDSIADSQISKIKYSGPSGESNQIVYNYNTNDMLVQVDYPAGNPVRYEYTFKDAGLADALYMDAGYLLSKVHHPSGFSSEYSYVWYEPKADINSFAEILKPDENKRYSYYLVNQKIHRGMAMEPRVTKYTYLWGSAYYQYPGEGTDVSRRWQFKKHTITDPKGRLTEENYVMGMLESVTFPKLNPGTMWETNYRILNEYDLNTLLQTRQIIMKGTSVQEKRFEYDVYGQLIKQADFGFAGNDSDSRITFMQYETSPIYVDADNVINAKPFEKRMPNPNATNIFGLVKEQWVEQGPANPPALGVPLPASNASAPKYQHVQREYSADGKGNVLSEKKFSDANNFLTSRMEYDSFGNAIKQYDGNNNLTQFEYEYNAYPSKTIKTVNGNTLQTLKHYSAFTGVPLSETNENNYTVLHQYDALGRPIKETHPDSTFVATEYLDAQNQTRVTDRKLRSTLYSYNPYGELVSVVDPLLQQTRYETDKTGKLASIYMPDGRQYRFEYDTLDRPIKLSYPDGTMSRKDYEDSANKILVWDENNHGMEYVYDAYGNLVQIVRGDTQAKTSYEYDLSNAINKIQSPLNYQTTFGNDLLGRRLSKKLHNNDTELFSYDANSNLTQHTNYESKPIQTQYDALNRPLKEIYQDSQFNVNYEYDLGAFALGKLSKVSDESGTTEFEYNSLGLMTKATIKAPQPPIGGAMPDQSYEINYNYDNTGLLTSILYPQISNQSFESVYEYDVLDRMKTLKLKTNGAPETLYTNQYDVSGRLTQRDYGNGMKEVFSYDAKDRLIAHAFSTSTQTIFEYKYQYDPAGNMTQRDIQDNNVLNRRDLYTYDYINQLTKIDVPGNKDLEYAYDKHYNRMFTNHAFGTMQFNYDLATNELLSYEESNNPNNPAAKLRIEYQYSKQGNPLFKKYKDTERNQYIDQEKYTWNDRDELIGISGRITQNYEYDYQGLRTKKVVQKSATESVTYRYVYLQNHQPALKIRAPQPPIGGGNPATFTDLFVYDGSKRVMRVRLSDTGEVKQKEFFINDYLGNPVVIVNQVQNIQYQTYQDPWGNLEMSVGVPSSNPEFKFTDKELDEDSDLYYFQARYLDPITGRFWGRDKVVLESEPKSFFHLNPFVFVYNSPTRFTDPDGNLPWDKLVGNSKLTSTYGTRTHPISQKLKTHHGNDYGSTSGADILSAANGVVSGKGYDKNGWGWYVEVKHFDQEGNPTYKTRYAHMKNGTDLKVGQQVFEGDTLGHVGKTGAATGPHLHVELQTYESTTKKWVYQDLNDKGLKNIGIYKNYSQTPSGREAAGRMSLTGSGHRLMP
jgi:RHS repeat-associated protein